MRTVLAERWAAKLIAAGQMPWIPQYREGFSQHFFGCSLEALKGSVRPADQPEAMATLLGLAMGDHRARARAAIAGGQQRAWAALARRHLRAIMWEADVPDAHALVRALCLATKPDHAGGWLDHNRLALLHRFLNVPPAGGGVSYALYVAGYGIPGIRAAMGVAQILAGPAALRSTLLRRLRSYLRRAVLRLILAALRELRPPR
jgi:hypothetical protein